MNKPRWLTLCFWGFHKRKIVSRMGTELFCIVATAKCERCGRMQFFNGSWNDLPNQEKEQRR
jgi:hypothetical protein